jgi:hypothetical protein
MPTNDWRALMSSFIKMVRSFDQLTTNAKGDYDFELPLSHLYTFSFVLDGHSNKRIEVDASGIPESVIGNRNMDLDMSMLPLPRRIRPLHFRSCLWTGRVRRKQEHRGVRQQLHGSNAE